MLPNYIGSKMTVVIRVLSPISCELWAFSRMYGLLSDLPLQKHDLCPWCPQHSLLSGYWRRHTSPDRVKRTTVFDKLIGIFFSRVSPFSARFGWHRLKPTTHVKTQPILPLHHSSSPWWHYLGDDYGREKVCYKVG